MKCPSCQQDNREGAAFCDRCGSVLAPKCPNCSAQLRPGARFCDSCGVSVSDPQPAEAKAVESDPREFTPSHLVSKILKERGRIEGERRNVTVLFADAKGFTPMSEKLDAEQVYNYIQGSYEHMLDAVHRHEGTVNQFTGDGIMALFGAPIAHEDSARRAVAAGLDMQRALTAYAAESGAPLAFRIGINTGPVVVGDIGDDLKMDYTAIGDTTNLAARMEQMAEPDSVYLTETTYRAVAEYFDFEDLGLLDVKGKSDKVHVFKALGERDVRTRMDAAVARGLSPFCGREREVETLKGMWQEALGGHGQIVLISGEPGIGKSRLLLELHRALGDDVIWREAHCVSYGENIPYLPVIELVKSGFGIADGDDEGTIITKVDVDTAQWSTQAQKTGPYLKFLLQVDPGDAAIELMDPMERRAGILDALRALVLERSRVAPRVVVVEDLHWADAQSEEVIRAIADVVSASPVLMIVTFRPGYLHPSGDLPHANRIVLSDLDADARCALAEATLEAAELPDSLVGPVTMKAEGNPLFIEEVAKAIAGGATDVGAVPNSLQDVILARIDRLEAAARESLQLASVIGREFTHRLLNRISDVQSGLEGVLSELKGLELIYEKAFFPELAYMFKHALTHDVAYSTLLVERRKTLHRVVALAIEELYAERITEHFETLAHHYLQAEEWEKAFDYLVKAGDKAASAFASSEAAAFYLDAIEVGSHLGPAALREVAALHEKRGLTNAGVGLLEAAADDFNRMIEIGRQLDDRRIEAWGLVNRGGWVEYFGHLFEEGAATLEQALTVCDEDDLDIAYGALAFLAGIYVVVGKMDEAREAERKLKKIGDENATPTYRSWMSLFRGAIPNWQGHYQQAVDAIRSLRPLDGVAKPIALFLDWFEGLAQAGQGKYQAAIEQIEPVVQDAERVGDVFAGLRAINTIGWIYGELQDVDRAIEWNERCLKAAAGLTFPDPEIESNVHLNLADMAILEGRFEDAERHLQWVERPVRAPKPADRFALWIYTGHFLHTYGELCLARGELARARAFAEECIEQASEMKRAKNEVKGRRLLAQVAMARGDLDEAERELAIAHDIAREIGNPPQLWKTLVALGDLRRAKGEDGKEAYEEALGVIDNVATGLSDERLRSTFLKSEHVRGIREAARQA
jgi:class 3 adenylate cyclase/tetratricopeptide (TPR) repeat protein